MAFYFTSHPFHPTFCSSHKVNVTIFCHVSVFVKWMYPLKHDSLRDFFSSIIVRNASHLSRGVLNWIDWCRKWFDEFKFTWERKTKGNVIIPFASDRIWAQCIRFQIQGNLCLSTFSIQSYGHLHNGGVLRYVSYIPFSLDVFRC